MFNQYTYTKTPKGHVCLALVSADGGVKMSLYLRVGVLSEVLF